MGTRRRSHRRPEEGVIPPVLQRWNFSQKWILSGWPPADSKVGWDDATAHPTFCFGHLQLCVTGKKAKSFQEVDPTLVQTNGWVYGPELGACWEIGKLAGV